MQILGFQMEEIEHKLSKLHKYPLRSIYFYLTEGCNLRCRHCYINPKFQTNNTKWNSLDFNVFKSIIKQAIPLGLRSVKLTGGEPLLHPQIFGILNEIKNADIRLIIETNGMLITSELGKLINSCKKTFVSVSIDGATAATHDWIRGVKGSYKKAIDGIKTLVKIGIDVQIIMTIQNKNKSEIESLINLADKLNVESVKLNFLQPIGRGKIIMNEMGAPEIEELIRIGEWIENDLSHSADLRIHCNHPPAFRPLGKLFSKGNDVNKHCNMKIIIGVLHNGLYALCGIAKNDNGLVFGNASNESLSEVWNNNSLLSEIREGIPVKLKGICKTCLIKALCEGYCIALNYYQNEDIYSSNWYCEEAMKIGLFNKNRLAVSH